MVVHPEPYLWPYTGEHSFSEEERTEGRLSAN